MVSTALELPADLLSILGQLVNKKIKNINQKYNLSTSLPNARYLSFPISNPGMEL